MKLALSILCENPRRRTGLSTLFHEFVAAALRERPEVRWVIFAGPNQDWPLVDERIEVVRRFPANDRRLARLWADHFAVAPEAKRRGADALVTVGFVPLRPAGLPVAMQVVTLRHLQPGGGPGLAYRRWAVARGVGRAALVIANSAWAAARLREAYPVFRTPAGGARLVVSPEAVQHDRFHPGPVGAASRRDSETAPAWPRDARSAPPLPDAGTAGAAARHDGDRDRAARRDSESLPPPLRGGAAYLLWSGNFYPYKRADRVIAAYARLAPALRDRFPLVLAGGDWQGGRARAEAAARAGGVAGQVHFLGWVADEALPALYRGARAHVLSSMEETFGRSVTEAMACGCPCVLQDLPVLREVTGGAAVFVHYADAAAAAGALTRICTDERLAAALREQGLRRAAEFNFSRLARERIDAIASVLRPTAGEPVAARAPAEPSPETAAAPAGGGRDNSGTEGHEAERRSGGPKPIRVSNPSASAWWAALVCAVAGAAVFQFFGNANHGYIKTNSLFWWWVYQWINPESQTQHGWLILALSVWLVVRALRARHDDVGMAACGREGDGGRAGESGAVHSLALVATGEASAGTAGASNRKSLHSLTLAATSSPSAAAGAADNRESEIENRNSDHSLTLVATSSQEADNRKSDAALGAAPAGPSTPHSALRTPGFCFRHFASFFFAGAALFGGLALHAVGFAAQQARLSIVGLLVFAWGVFRLGGGRRWGAATAFPLAFLVFALPLNALDSIGFWLRLWVVEASTALAHLVHIGVLENGTRLVAPDGRYQYDVAAACSGIRSLMALSALSLLIGYLNFRSWWRRGALLLLCFPLVYVGNVARIFTIIVAAQLGGPRWGDAAHEVMGYGVFVIVLGGVLAAAAAVRRIAPERTRKPGAEPEPAGPRAAGRAFYVGRGARAMTPALLASVVVAAAVGEGCFLHRVATRPERGRAGVALTADGRNPVELPAFLNGGWVGLPVAVTAVERAILPPDTGYSRMDYVSSRTGQHVLLSIVLSGRDRTSIHRPELCLVGQGWTITGRGRHEFTDPGRPGARFPATVLRVRREIATPAGPRIVPQLVVYWFVGGRAVVASDWHRLLLDSWNRVVHARADRWAYVFLQADATGGEAAALARMQRVLDGTLPVFAPARRALRRGTARTTSAHADSPGHAHAAHLPHLRTGHG